MKHKLLLSLGTVLTATFSFPLIAELNVMASDKKEEKKKVEEPAKQAEGAGTGDKTTSASGTANSNGASSNSTNAQKTDEKEIKETSDSPKKDGEKVSDKHKVAYKDIDFDFSKIKIVISKKDIKDEDLIPPKKGNNKQVFFDTRDGDTKLSWKVQGKITLKRCWNWNCYWSTRRIFNCWVLKIQSTKTEKAKLKLVDLSMLKKKETN
nr:variable surface lipoprotein [Mycoplasmopsis bovis]